MKRLLASLSLLSGLVPPAAAQALPPNLLAMGVDTARMLGAHGSGIPIVFFDTGLNPPLDIKLYHAGGLVCSTGIHGWGPCGTPDPTPSIAEQNPNCSGPDYGHGTGTAGSAAGKWGVADSASIYMLRVVAPTGPCKFEQQAFWQGLQAVMDSGGALAKIANISLTIENSGAFYMDTLQSQNFVALGGIICAASGNDGHDYLQWPAQVRGVFGVGSIESDFSRSWYSNFGGHGTQLSYVAMATNVQTDYACAGCAAGSSSQVNSGTSFAAPQICAHFADLKSIAPTSSRAELIALTDATVFFPGHSPGDSIYFGKGLPQTGKAVCALVCIGPTPDASSLTLAPGQTDSIRVTPHNGKPWVPWTTDSIAVVQRNGWLVVTAPATPGTFTVKLGTTSPDTSSLRGH